MMTLDWNVHGRTLRLLDRLFPPNPQGFMSAEQSTEYEVAKASETMGAISPSSECREPTISTCSTLVGSSRAAGLEILANIYYISQH
jgi:hypothetical protein